MSSDLQIRPYRKDDEEAIIALWKACGLIFPQNNPHKDIQRKLRVNPECFLVGEMSQEIVATCMAGYDGHRGWIYYLGVSPNKRRQHIGAQIVAEAERLLRQVGCPKINLQVRTTNLQVIEFYRNLGFKIDEVASMGKRLEIDDLTANSP